MPDPIDREATLDSNFVETIALLNSRNVPYWACHGTLLGLVRDGRLIPWDHDIDLAIWADDFPKNSLLELMVGSGYALKSDGSDYDFMQFTKGDGREVDFNFYRVTPGSEIAYSEWFISRSKLTSLIDLISKRGNYGGKWSGCVSSLYFLSPLAGCLARALKKAGLFYKSAGYTTPANLLRDFRYLEIPEAKVRVPCSHDAVLQYVYGKDWRVPKRQYDWTKESPSTRVSGSRFR